VEIKVAVGDIVQAKADAIIVNFFEEITHPEGDLAFVDKALDGAISKLISEGEIKGKLREITVVHSLGKLPAARVVIVGLGKQSELTLDKVRGVVAETCRFLRQKDIDSIATIAQGAGVVGISVESAAQAVTEGALLGTYAFRKHMTKEAEYGDIKQVTIVDADETKLSSLERG